MESETPSGVRTARTARKKMTRTRKASKKMRRGKVWRMNETDVSTLEGVWRALEQIAESISILCILIRLHK